MTWWKSLRTAAILLLCSSAVMTVFKLAIGGKLHGHCYAMLIEFCKVDCWDGQPFSSFPLKCNTESDIVVIVLANLGAFVFALGASATCFFGCRKLARCRDTREDADALPLRKFGARASAPKAGSKTMRGYTRFNDEEIEEED